MRRKSPTKLSLRMYIVTNAIAHNKMAETKKKQGPNWTSKEEEILTKAWSKGTHNSLYSNYQKEGPYWDDIAKHYHGFASVQGLSECSINLMQNRWGTINRACTKFNGVFTQVTHIPKSGWNEEKYFKCAFAVYLKEMKE